MSACTQMGLWISSVFLISTYLDSLLNNSLLQGGVSLSSSSFPFPEHTRIHWLQYGSLFGKKRKPLDRCGQESPLSSKQCTLPPHPSRMHRTRIYYGSSEHFCLCWCSHLKIQVLWNSFEYFISKGERQDKMWVIRAERKIRRCK